MMDYVTDHVGIEWEAGDPLLAERFAAVILAADAYTRCGGSSVTWVRLSSACEKIYAEEVAAICTYRDREPTDDEIYNRVGVEGGIAYDTSADEPGSLGENDYRL